VTAHVKLLDRPSACILWIFFDPDTLSLGPFLWFGGAAGEKIPTLGEKIARHTKPNAMLEKADRPAHRVVRFSRRETHMSDIERRQLGRTGLSVTALGFGAMDLGGPPRAANRFDHRSFHDRVSATGRSSLSLRLLPFRRRHDGSNRCASGRSQHRDDAGVLGVGPHGCRPCARFAPIDLSGG
jgi:hypothetical protein